MSYKELKTQKDDMEGKGMKKTAADLRGDLHDYNHIIKKYDAADAAEDEAGKELAREWMKSLREQIHEGGREYEFVYTSTWSSAVEAGWAFVEAGCEVFGMTTVNSQHKAFKEDRFEEVPGYCFRITGHAPSKEE